MFKVWKTWKLQALYRCAKVKARPWFADPRVMIELRRELEDRGCYS